MPSGTSGSGRRERGVGLAVELVADAFDGLFEAHADLGFFDLEPADPFAQLAELLLGFGAFPPQPVEPAAGLHGPLPTAPAGASAAARRAVRCRPTFATSRSAIAVDCRDGCRSSSVRRARAAASSSGRAASRASTSASRWPSTARRSSTAAPRTSSPGAGARPRAQTARARRVARVPHRRRRARLVRAGRASAISASGMRRGFRSRAASTLGRQRRLPFLERRAPHLDVTPQLRGARRELVELGAAGAFAFGCDQLGAAGRGERESRLLDARARHRRVPSRRSRRPLRASASAAGVTADDPGGPARQGSRPRTGRLRA